MVEGCFAWINKFFPQYGKVRQYNLHGEGCLALGLEVLFSKGKVCSRSYSKKLLMAFDAALVLRYLL